MTTQGFCSSLAVLERQKAGEGRSGSMRLDVFLSYHRSGGRVTCVCTQKEQYMFKASPKPESRNSVYLFLQRAWQSPFSEVQLPGS